MNMATTLVKRSTWRGRRIGLLILLLLPSLSNPCSSAIAARGVPGSAEFGFGARLDVWGSETELAVKAAVAIGLDWLAVDFDWSRHWTDESKSPKFERLDLALAQISQHNIYVLFTITSPPSWALTPTGPDPVKVTQLLTLLIERYGENISAIELFPGANTIEGWGAAPNPQAYAILIRHVHQALEDTNSSALIVAGGLHPLADSDGSFEMDDLAYLADLYQAGAAEYMPVISVRLEDLSSRGLTEGGEINTRELRHYEVIRQVMKENDHMNGLVWVTAYKLPEPTVTDPSATQKMQIRWLNQALLMMKSQLYIGVAFLDPLNPSLAGVSTIPTSSSLIQTQAGEVFMHPAFSALGHIITTVHTGHNTNFQLSLYKKISGTTLKNMMKGTRP